MQFRMLNVDHIMWYGLNDSRLIVSQILFAEIDIDTYQTI